MKAIKTNSKFTSQSKIIKRNNLCRVVYGTHHLNVPTYIPVENYRKLNESYNYKGLFNTVNPPPLAFLTFDDFLKDVNNGSVEKVIVTEGNNKIKVIKKTGVIDDVNVPKNKATNLYQKLTLKNVDIEINQDVKNEIFNAFITFISWGSILLFGSIIIRMFMSGGGSNGANSPFNFAKSKAILIEKDIGVTFNDIAGLDGAKIELQEVIDFLKNPEKYTVLGAKIPKGCLLVGPPGTGKTMLAKACAGEAKVPFFSCSASEFVEMFVGVGASRVRDLFKTAGENSPCIIFIDEIDAIGRARGSSSVSGGGNDEREQTINQLLTEMDGFKTNAGVIILAATNRVDVLDPALLRPGRFDRQIQAELPDQKGRLEILKVHVKNKPLDSNISLESLSRITTGYSGADLANLTNEAAILAARRDKKIISKDEFDDAIEKILLGLKRESHFSPEKKKLVAFHEAGHTLVALKCGVFDNIRKVSIVPRGKTGGVTIFEPDENHLQTGLYSKEYLLNQICVALGGRIAEEVVYNKSHVTTGASSDIEKVQMIARMMVVNYGFSDKVGPISWKSSNRFDNSYSEMILSDIDNEVKRIVDECYKLTKQLVVKNRKSLDLIAEKLIEHETLSGEEVDELLATIATHDVITPIPKI